MDQDKWFTGGLVSLLTALISMVMLFYFYTGAFGVELLWVDILILLLAVAFGQLLGLHVYRNGAGINGKIVMILFVAIVLVFTLFTYAAPNLPIFQDMSQGGKQSLVEYARCNF